MKFLFFEVKSYQTPRLGLVKTLRPVYINRNIYQRSIEMDQFYNQLENQFLSLIGADPRFVGFMFICFLFTKTIVENYLELRNKRYIRSHQNHVPQKFSQRIDLKDHQKAAQYSVAKINAGQFFYFYELIILLLWTFGGGLTLLDNFVRNFDNGPIVSGLIFFGLFGLISMLLGLPQNLYSTFILEEKFGFNKTTPKIFIQDMIKGILLSLVIGVPILSGILGIMQSMGQWWWLYAWIFFTVVQLSLILIYPNFIAPLFNKFVPLQEGELKNEVVDLLKAVDFSHDELFVMDASKRSSHGNAYFTGFGKKKRIVLFDTLLNNLTPKEVRAVLAHELGHFKKRHIVKKLTTALVMALIAFFILGILYKSPIFYIGHGVVHISDYMALALFSMISGVYTFFITPISSWSSRKHEFEADAFASKHAKAFDLISALIKLYKDNASTLTPDPLYSAYYHSHPPALIRVQHLEKLQDNPSP